ncbi:hypothetical protein ANN_05319 [Periplaneta americana]|uniref:Uncharacterized protein n=1 Tax=Periplaneta americana TaxID=6978 RepID=A0ABQ8TCU0_PERAM|nr:hypothetical protein ANN_05319 [Periplaneta americana]
MAGLCEGGNEPPDSFNQEEASPVVGLPPFASGQAEDTEFPLHLMERLYRRDSVPIAFSVEAECTTSSRGNNGSQSAADAAMHNSSTYEFPYVKPERLRWSENVRKEIWNAETHEFLGRTAKSWEEPIPPIAKVD